MGPTQDWFMGRGAFFSGGKEKALSDGDPQRGARG